MLKIGPHHVKLYSRSTLPYLFLSCFIELGSNPLQATPIDSKPLHPPPGHSPGQFNPHCFNSLQATPSAPDYLEHNHKPF